jgi:hypothetical protein
MPMNEKLNNDLIQIALKRNELNRLQYNCPEYDSVEDELHEMEDQFNQDHGKTLEDAIASVHNILCPDTEVMLPIAYIAKKYLVTPDEETGMINFDPPAEEGFLIDSLDHPGQIMRLVLVPNPVRILLQSENNVKLEVWKDQ